MHIKQNEPLIVSNNAGSRFSIAVLGKPPASTFGGFDMAALRTGHSF